MIRRSCASWMVVREEEKGYPFIRRRYFVYPPDNHGGGKVVDVDSGQRMSHWLNNGQIHLQVRCGCSVGGFVLSILSSL